MADNIQLTSQEKDYLSQLPDTHRGYFWEMRLGPVTRLMFEYNLPELKKLLPEERGPCVNAIQYISMIMKWTDTQISDMYKVMFADVYQQAKEEEEEDRKLCSHCASRLEKERT